MNKTFDGQAYEIRPIEAYATPLNVKISQLLQLPGKEMTTDEALAFSIDLSKLFPAFFKACVTPEPKPEHWYALYSLAQDATKEAFDKADWFRKPKKLDDKTGSAASTNSKEASK